MRMILFIREMIICLIPLFKYSLFLVATETVFFHLNLKGLKDSLFW